MMDSVYYGPEEVKAPTAKAEAKRTTEKHRLADGFAGWRKAFIALFFSFKLISAHY